ncbi:hypothetical protein KAR10_06510 [bacterium]|nr:hypothetical protein [bacterium]
MQRIGKILYICPVVFIFLMSSCLKHVFAASADFKVAVRIINFDRNLLKMCDNHEWEASDGWGSGITINLSYSKYGTDERNSLRAGFTVPDDGDPNNNWGPFYVQNCFAPEGWSGTNKVLKVEVDVLMESGAGRQIELLLKSISDAQLYKSTSEIVLTPGDWVTMEWNLPDITDEVAVLTIIPMKLQDNDIMHFSNLRITRQISGVEIWDDFKAPSYFWMGSNDFKPWNTSGVRNDPISHKITHNNSAGALYIPWDSGQSTEPVAKMEALNLYGMDLTSCTKIRAWVYSDQIDAPIYMAFWDGPHYLPTTPQTVTTANNWELLEWNKPAGEMDWACLKVFMFMIDTETPDVLPGEKHEIYIDDIEFVE